MSLNNEDNRTLLLNANDAKSLIPCRIELINLEDKTSGFMAVIRNGESVMVGRDIDSCDIALVRDTLVSDQHCRFEREGVDIFLTDMGSEGGTYLADERLTERTLIPDGSVIRIGGAGYKVTYNWR